jgi:hypothetical protein
MNRDFTQELTAMFSKFKEPTERVLGPGAKQGGAEDTPTPPVTRFNVIRTVGDTQRTLEIGLTFSDALRAINGRYKDSEKDGIPVAYIVVRDVTW